MNNQILKAMKIITIMLKKGKNKFRSNKNYWKELKKTIMILVNKKKFLLKIFTIFFINKQMN